MVAVFVALFLVGVPLLVWVQATMEAQSYNKLTGAKVTAWDALWVHLRVQDSPK